MCLHTKFQVLSIILITSPTSKRTPKSPSSIGLKVIRHVLIWKEHTVSQGHILIWKGHAVSQGWIQTVSFASYNTLF